MDYTLVLEQIRLLLVDNIDLLNDVIDNLEVTISLVNLILMIKFIESLRTIGLFFRNKIGLRKELK